jgi:hypothetical protein
MSLTKITTNVIDNSSLGKLTEGGFKNLAINGDMRINQRAVTTFSTSEWNVSQGLRLTADRHKVCLGRLSVGNSVPSGDMTFTVVKNDLNVPTGFTHKLKWVVNTPETNPFQYYAYGHYLEAQHSSAVIGFGTPGCKPFTLSFWLRTNVPGTYTGMMRYVAGESEAIQLRTYPYTFTASGTGNWEHISIVVPPDATSSWLTPGNTVRTDNREGLIFWLDLGFDYAETSTALVPPSEGNKWQLDNKHGVQGATKFAYKPAGSYFEMTGLQIEVGDTATSFEHRPYQAELALCQRYYEVGTSMESKLLSNAGSGYLDDLVSPITPTFEIWHSFKVEKRSSPSITADCWVTGDGKIQPAGQSVLIDDPYYGARTLTNYYNEGDTVTVTGRSIPHRATGNPAISGYSTFYMMSGGSNCGYSYPHTTNRSGWLQRASGEQGVAYWRSQAVDGDGDLRVPTIAKTYAFHWDTAPFVYNWRAESEI